MAQSIKALVAISIHTIVYIFTYHRNEINGSSFYILPLCRVFYAHQVLYYAIFSIKKKRQTREIL